MLRGHIQGVDGGDLSERYLGERLDPRRVRSMLEDMRDDLARRARLADRADLAERISRSVGVPETSGPTLEEFATRFEPGFFTEAELLDRYREEFGQAARSIERRMKLIEEQLDAVTAIEALPVPHRHRPVDRLVEWWREPYEARLAVRLAAAGIHTFAELAEAVRKRPKTWWRVAGVGPQRAERLVARWLSEACGAIAPPCPFAPLDRLAPLAANSERPRDELAAVREWLATKTGATREAYRTEIERFAHWMYLVRQKPIASADAAMLEAYALFLRAVPAGWCSGASRGSTAWRPFRGSLHGAAHSRACKVVAALLRWLAAQGYCPAALPDRRGRPRKLPAAIANEAPVAPALGN
jgi:hypothetical protein